MLGHVMSGYSRLGQLRWGKVISDQVITRYAMISQFRSG
jgi:hypothetical protein